MKIKLVSDCHLEFSDLEIKNDKNYDVLILAGDILNAEELHDYPDTSNVDEKNRRMLAAARYRKFLSNVSSEFPTVIYVAGNHEFYRGKFHQGIDYLYDECSKYPNVFFLEKDYKIIDNIAFIGATLWTDCNKADPNTLYIVKNLMNDYTLIKNDKNGYRKLSPTDTVERHRASLKFFQQTITDLKKDGISKFVIVSHHSPSYLSIHPSYETNFYMNGAYHSDLSDFILDNPEIVLFTHGHTHNTFDYNIGNTRVVCNPRGYQSSRYNENTGWNPDIEIDI